CTIAIDREERVMERQRLTYSDALTGLSNRARFNQLLAEELPRSRRAWGILLVDNDRFSEIGSSATGARKRTGFKIVDR
ncbi:diguanylate cyclase domain-containing protein, partial [Rhizobium ruizarguesonis]